MTEGWIKGRIQWEREEVASHLLGPSAGAGILSLALSLAGS